MKKYYLKSHIDITKIRGGRGHPLLNIFDTSKKYLIYIKNFEPAGHKQEGRQPKLKYNLEIFVEKGGN